jgi:hypothetical protein
MLVVDKELPLALIDLIISVLQTLMGGILMCLVTGYFALTLPPVFLIVWGKQILRRILLPSGAGACFLQFRDAKILYGVQSKSRIFGFVF